MGTIIAKGIDVSKHQGNIYWTVAKNSIDFAMIRAGYGTTVDENFGKNAKSCSLYGIPFGAYWFSYALSVEEAKEEEKMFLQTVAKHNLTYPLAFDFECASYDYMVKNKITPTKELIIDIATAFLTEIEKAGYYAMIYANKDYVTKYFNTLREKYDLWYARWNVEVPDLACGMWQKGTASIAGISVLVDLDYSYNHIQRVPA